MNIIEKTEIVAMPEWTAPVMFAVALGIMVIMATIAIVREKHNKKHGKKTTYIRDLFLMFIAIPVVIVVGFIAKSMKQPTGRYTYKASLDNSISVNEFYDKYTNIQQLDEEGLFYFEDKAQ